MFDTKWCCKCGQVINPMENHRGIGPALGATKFYHDLCLDIENKEKEADNYNDQESDYYKYLRLLRKGPF